MPSWLVTILTALLSLALPWLEANASTTIVAIVQEIIAFLQSVQQKGLNVEAAAKDLLAHIQKVTNELKEKK